MNVISYLIHNLNKFNHSKSSNNLFIYICFIVLFFLIKDIYKKRLLTNKSSSSNSSILSSDLSILSGSNFNSDKDYDSDSDYDTQSDKTPFDIDDDSNNSSNSSNLLFNIKNKYLQQFDPLKKYLLNNIKNHNKSNTKLIHLIKKNNKKYEEKINQLNNSIKNFDNDLKNLQQNLYSNHFKDYIRSNHPSLFEKPNLFSDPHQFNNLFIQYLLYNKHLLENPQYVENKYFTPEYFNHIQKYNHHFNQHYHNNETNNNDKNINNQNNNNCNNLKNKNENHKPEINIYLNQKNNKDVDTNSFSKKECCENKNHYLDYMPQSIFTKSYENLDCDNQKNKLNFHFKIQNNKYVFFKFNTILNQEFFGLVKISIYLMNEPYRYFNYIFNDNNSIYASIHQFGLSIENNFLNKLSDHQINNELNKEHFYNPIENPHFDYDSDSDDEKDNIYHDVCFELEFVYNPNKNIDTNKSENNESSLILSQGITEEYFKNFVFKILKFKFEVLQSKKPELHSIKPLNIEMYHDSFKAPLILDHNIRNIFEIGNYYDKEYWNKNIEKDNQINRSIVFVENVTNGDTIRFN